MPVEKYLYCILYHQRVHFLGILVAVCLYRLAVTICTLTHTPAANSVLPPPPVAGIPLSGEYSFKHDIVGKDILTSRVRLLKHGAPAFSLLTCIPAEGWTG